MANPAGFDIARRTAIGQFAGVLLGCGVSACPREEPSDPLPSALRQSIGVDAHCHVFNAADLPTSTFVLGAKSPIKQFLVNHPLVGRAANLILDALLKLVTTCAPDDHAEVAFLDGRPVTDPLQHWDQGIGGFLKDLLADEAPVGRRLWAPEFPLEFESERRWLGDALRAEFAPEAWSNPTSDQLLQLSIKLPGGVSDALRTPILWCRQLCDFRLRNVDRLLELYGQERLGVALLLPALVDFHRWLPDVQTPLPEGAPKVKLDQQVALMERIIRVRPGVHPFLAFDPLAPWEASQALLNKCFNLDGKGTQGNGFAGVKLYPPMGYAPLGNDHLRTVSPTIAQMVDENLVRLYDYCIAYDVPIMAHCNASNDTATGQRNETFLARKWRQVVEMYPALRINLAHFGGAGEFADRHSTGDQTPEQDEIARLMATGEIYSDLAHETGVEDEAFRRKLSTALDDYFGRFPIARTRLMYGSDWIMLGLDRSFPNYLGHWFAQSKLFMNENTQAGFFGVNALAFMGVTRSGLSRKRLERFYQEIGQQPLWLTGSAGDAG